MYNKHVQNLVSRDPPKIEVKPEKGKSAKKSSKEKKDRDWFDSCDETSSEDEDDNHAKTKAGPVPGPLPGTSAPGAGSMPMGGVIPTNSLSMPTVKLFNNENHVFRSASASSWQISRSTLEPKLKDFNIVYNLDREKCAHCRRWFSDVHMVRRHQGDWMGKCRRCGQGETWPHCGRQQKHGFGCERCKLCFDGEKQLKEHFKAIQHTRCYYWGGPRGKEDRCKSRFAEGSWIAEDIKDHVDEDH
jgi:hypothetical protein